MDIICMIVLVFGLLGLGICSILVSLYLVAIFTDKIYLFDDTDYIDEEEKGER